MRNSVLYQKYLVALLLFVGTIYGIQQYKQCLSTQSVFTTTNDGDFQADFSDYDVLFEQDAIALQLEGTSQALMAMQFEGANTSKPTRNDGALWYNNLYQHTNLKFYPKGAGVAYDFLLEPGANVNDIQLKVAANAYLTTDGELALPINGGEIRHTAPYAYQEIEGKQVLVESEFELQDDILGFELGHYNPDYAVVIDPTIYLMMPFVYENTTSGTLNNSADCSTILTRTITVTDNFTVEDLNVGLNFNTSYRGNVRVQLTSPQGTTITLKNFSGDGDDNLDVLLDDASNNSIDDDDDNDTSSPFYDRTADPESSLLTFYGEQAMGDWTLTFCNSKELADLVGGDSNSDRQLTFNRAQLTFDNLPPAQNCSVDIVKVGIGNCINSAVTNNVSTSLVTVEVETVTEESVLIAFNGETKILDLTVDGSPRYVSFFVNLDTTTVFNKTITAQVIGTGCSLVDTMIVLPSPCPQASACGAAGTLGGTVYNDFDANGTQGASEFGLKDVAVNVFDEDQNLLCATLTDDSGNWTCTGLTNGTPVRVEFFNFPVGFFPSETGTQNDGGSVQFATVGSDCDIDFALLSPGEFCQNEPFLIVPCYFVGNPLIQGSEAADADVLVAVPFDASGNNDENIYLSKGEEIGSTWGLAFNKDTRNVFASALLKRHTGWGPNGLSAIYKRNVAALPSTTGTTSLYVDLEVQFGIDAGNEAFFTGTRDFTGNGGDPSYDSLAFDQIGKMGFGDIDITDDFDTLFAVNLMTQSLVRIVNDPTTDTPISATEIPIPNPGCSAASDWRPWATKYYRGKLYVGGICSAQSTQDDDDLKAVVYEYNITTQQFTTLLTFDLDYPKGSPASFLDQESDDCKNWNPWTDDFQKLKEPSSSTELCYPQPILSDIEFDALGNMSLAFIDRAGHQMGWFNYSTSQDIDDDDLFKGNTGGDILRVYNNNGHYVLEKNATAGYTTTVGANNGQGPTNGEFYYQDAFGGAHQETVLGGLALQPSNNQIILGAMDATGTFSNGLAWYDNSTGAPTQQYRVFFSGNNGDSGTFGKAAGLGDLELSCTQATQEIGNFVFIDAARNDVQDATDTPLDGINVTLYDQSGNVVATKMTDTKGYYYFDTSDGVVPGTQYYVAFGTGGQFNTTTGILTINSVEYVLLAPDLGFGTRSDLNDSDASIGTVGLPAPVVGLPVVSIMTDIQGRSNHTFDVGFRPAAEFDLALRKEVAFAGVFAPNDIVSYQITVLNQGTINASSIEVTDYVPSDLIFVGVQSGAVQTVNGNTANITNNGGGVFTIDALAAGDVVKVNVQFQISPSFAGTSITNFSEISAATGGIDIDSTPDNTDNNDAGGVPGGVTDNEVLFAPPIDEDDHDPAQIQIILGAIGNYVWLDEDSNGYQDEGEVGIPNVQVNLKDQSGTVIGTTYTDSDGKYLFPDLPAATYFVDVVEATLPAGLTQTTDFTNSTDNDATTATGDGDFGNKDQSVGNGYQIALGLGEENLTADFGYNFNPTDDVNNPTGSPVAALGDRVWIDSDADGVQDVNEIGVSGVQLTLFTAGTDGLFGTGDDVSAGTTTTNANGFYLFDGLTPGVYVVKVTSSTGASHNVLLTGATGYDQTGDPDHFAENEANAPSGTANDNMSTIPVVLGPGDVFLNVDFGYQPGVMAPVGSIGNTIWFDADADGYGPDDSALDAAIAAANAGLGTDNGLGIDDNNEQPIAGVSVALIKDRNGDGIWDINGVDNTLGTADDEPIIGTDVTDANGQYLFEDLPLNDNGDGNNQDADYIVWVNDTENVLHGLKATYDGDETLFPVTTTAQATGNGNTANAVLGMSDVTLNVIAPNNRRQDFGYTTQGNSTVNGLIGDYVWFDTDRDGVQDATEAGIEGVLMELYDLGLDEAIGGGDDVLLGTTLTDENGYYYFGGLLIDANGEGYQVKVANSNFGAGEPLAGLENTFDPDNGTTDPDDSMGGAVSLSTVNPINLNQDFGYAGDDAVALGSIGNTIWEDTDADGVRDNGEIGFAGVTVDLYRDLNENGVVDAGEPRIGTTSTNIMGMYLFSQLPIDDNDGQNDGASYVVDVTDELGILNGYWHSLGSQDATTNSGNDPMDNSKVDAFAVTINAGTPNNLNVDFGYYKDPASVGNYVWLDTNGNGLQDDGETGINGAQVSLMIAYPDNTMTTILAVTVNDASGNAGFYQFPNLLLDEDYNGDGAGAEPVHTIKVDANQAVFTDADLVPTTANVNSNGNDLADSDDFAGVEAAPVQGNQNTAAVDPSTNENVVASYDFGVSSNVDYGDLADSGNGTSAGNYETQSANGGPSHVIDNNIKLGASIDSESDGQPSANADGDGADEDGIASFPTFTAGQSAIVTVSLMNMTGGNANLYGFIDWNNDGDFDDTDESPAAVVVADQVASAMITFNVPAGAVTGTNLGARFRFTTDDLSLLPEASEGAASDGEVEDYLVQAVANDLCATSGDTYLLDFDTDDAGNTLTAGVSNINTNQPYDNIFGGGMGITFTTNNPTNTPLNLYNSNGTGGEDPDLEFNGGWAGGNITTTILGNLLIINEGSDITNPDDNASGGILTSITTMDLDAISLDMVDLERVEIGLLDFIRFENTNTGVSVDVQFLAFEDGSGTIFETADVEFEDRHANRLSDITAAKLSTFGGVNLTSFNKITFNADASFGIGAICIKKAPVTLGAIGNYVWLDEDSNGLQDEGEAGIPNVQVDLKDMNGTVIATTFTDSDGEYLFPNLPAAMYFVDVVEATLPTGVSQTTTFTNVVDGADADTDNDDGDLGNKDQSQNGGYKITLDAGEENLTADFGYNYNPTDDVNNPTGSPVAALGDRVWIDSDGDGVQDPNEVGVEGVEVTLMGAGPDGIFGTGDDVTATTTTDENGFYLFDGLTPGAFMVTVTDDANASHDILNTGNYDQTGDPDHFAANESTAPAGTANDNKATRPVILGPGDVFLNVDFGYQPEAGTMLGSIGNTIWLDADADQNGPSAVNGDAFNGLGGQDDANEQPIAGVSVALIKDTNGNGVWEAGEPIIATDVTDENGQYLFEGLPITDGAGDDDYIVWVTDTDNVLDGLKPTYDADGGAVPTGSSAPLGNPTATLGISAVSDLTATPVTDQDFGYTPDAQDAGEGLIGDYVWFDTNRDGVQDANESGIEGVLVELYDLGADEQVGGGDDVLIATTTTDENGYYYFGGLTVDAGGEGYQVKVATSNFATGAPLQGLENTFDPDNGTTDPDDSMGGAVSLTSASPINLDQDFGYVGDSGADLGSIGDLVWEDLDADGVQDASEVGIAGVTLDLYRDLNGDGQINPGEPRIGTTTTDANGLYLFDELPIVTGGNTYIVDVTDEAGVLNGYWHSVSPNQDATTNGGNDGMDNSKVDAFAVTIDGTIPDNRNVDFGYYKDPASVGNYVWNDENANGLQDDGETGINGVQVTLMITYPDGTMSTIVTTTVDDAAGNAGFYEFPNLLLDEDYNGDGAGSEPVHTIKVNAAQTVFTNANLVPTTANVNSNGNDLADSDSFTGVTASPVQGNQNTAAVDPSTDENVVASYDFGVRQVVDLATIIQITSSTPAQGYYDNDDAITFKVTVANQGDVAASDVTVTNYLPATLENAALVASSLMINGNPAPAGVTITKVGNDYVIDFGTNTANWLQPTDVLMFSFTADITDGTTPGTVITNTVEIETFDTDNNSNTDVPTDVDSTPDATNGNTSGEVSPDLEDDQLTENGQAGNDEDDHDIAVLTADLVLPVELVAFRAEAKSDYIALTWTTASELNNDRFEIERSEDAKSFKQLGTVKGKGTTVETTDYSFEDRTAIPGVLYYYRLKQVDTDGTFDYSDIRVAQLAGDIQEMLIYPSPLGSGQKLNVRLYTENARVEFVIADMQNRVAKVFKLDVPQNGWNIFELEVQDLPSGSYFITGSEGQLGGFVKTNE